MGMSIPFNDLRRSFSIVEDEVQDKVASVVKSGWWVNGRSCQEFEQAFAEYLDAKHCVGVANGTDGLELALRALNLKEKNNVITVANAGGYTTTALMILGLTPVYCDIDLNSLQASIDSIISKVTEVTGAIVVTHLYGEPVDVRALRARLDSHHFQHVRIIEDCSQAHGAIINGQKVGTLGDAAVFSFYPTKNLGAYGDAGAVVTNDPTFANEVKQLKEYGWTNKYDVGLAGGRNSRMDELQAAVLSVQLKYLDYYNTLRIQARDFLFETLPSQIKRPQISVGNVAHLCVLISSQREELRQSLSVQGIKTDIHFPILDHQQKAWNNLSAPTLPNSELLVSQVFSLPNFVGITDQELEYVASSCKRFFE